jgi:hypothetical protein
MIINFNLRRIHSTLIALCGELALERGYGTAVRETTESMKSGLLRAIAWEDV